VTGPLHRGPGRRRALAAVAWGAAAVPFGVLLFRAATDRLGANPIEEITHFTGDWTLRFLLLSLAVTPARRRLGLAALAPWRRTFGLAAFGYATLHALTWAVLDQALDWHLLLEDVAERRFVTAGFAAWLCLLPLAATSTRRSQRRLGRRWIALHRLAYAAAALGVVHYAWLVKADLLPPILYGLALAALLGARARVRRRPAC
jgi:sulfoxide reductase heme-binding subunit YedZ